MTLSYLYSHLSPVNSKHLKVCESELSGACEERFLLPWWALIGIAKITVTSFSAVCWVSNQA